MYLPCDSHAYLGYDDDDNDDETLIQSVVNGCIHIFLTKKMKLFQGFINREGIYSSSTQFTI